MNVLESPLEALAFNYLSFGFVTAVNNLWTWVAVITAAVSFWRIKTAGGSTTLYSSDLHHQPCNDPNTTGSQPLPEISPVDSIIEPPAPAPAAASDTARSSSAVCDVKDDGDTKRKFTLYYHEEEMEESNTDGEITAVDQEWGEVYNYYRDHIHGCEEWWERVIRVRVVDMGWHRYQDSTVINGNIVRLWDDECMRRERHSSSCEPVLSGSWSD